MNIMSKRIVCGLLIMVFIVLCLVFDIPGLLRSEINTILFVREFDDPELFCAETALSPNVDEIKVLLYSWDYARVYYLTDKYQNAAIINYKKVDGKWQSDSSGYFLWTDDGGSANIDAPSQYWWYYRLRNKYQPMNEKYKTRVPIPVDDVIRHPGE